MFAFGYGYNARPVAVRKYKVRSAMELHQIMAQGMAMPMPMSGDVDKDFATMMTMHHQQAIKMIDVLLEHGDNASLKAMAQRMKSAQQKEITEMAPYTK